jgi:hypothetical protein
MTICYTMFQLSGTQPELIKIWAVDYSGDPKISKVLGEDSQEKESIFDRIVALLCEVIIKG